LAAIPYDAEVTLLWTVIIAAVSLGLLAGLVVSRGRPRGAGPLVTIAAAAAGVAGALVILGPRVDLVPDDIERLAVVGLIVLGSLGLIIATWIRAARQ
jgi:hypothetical protein